MTLDHDAADSAAEDVRLNRSTFHIGRPAWLNRLGNVRNFVRQELIARQLDKHLPAVPGRLLDVGAGQGTQAIRLARDGHHVIAVEPDPAMRGAFSQSLAEEPTEIRQRVTLLAGAIGDLTAVIGRSQFDAVLLLGVAMYLPSSQPVLAQLSDYVAPGGFLSIAIRTTTSAVWRPAARQDWKTALATLAELDAARSERRDMRYTNELGTAARADDPATFASYAASHGLTLENWYGIRIAVDSEELDPPPPEDPAELAALLEVEERLGSTDPYRELGQLAHFILRRAGSSAESTGPDKSPNHHDANQQRDDSDGRGKRVRHDV